MKLRVFNITYFAMSVGILPFIILILSLINLKTHPDPDSFTQIKSAINNYPLTKLIYAEDCENKQNLYTFPGYKLGCTCVGVYSYHYEQDHKYEVIPEECTYNQTYNGCKPVKPIEAKSLRNWYEGSFCSNKYDLKDSKLKGYFYFLYNSVLENEDCQEGFKKCGQLDDMGNYVCVPQEEECPINDIIISNFSRPDLEDLNYTSINFRDKYVYYTNEDKKKPVISQLKVAEEKLCKDKYYLYTNYPQYILDNNFERYGCRKKINGQFYDDSIEILDTRRKRDFYLDSSFDLTKSYDKWIYDFPFYNLEANMILYPERFNGFNKKCFKENKLFDMENSVFSEKNIDEMNKILNDSYFRNDLVKWFSIIAFTVELIACSAFNLDSEKYSIFIWLWTMINIIFYVCMAVPIYISISHMSNFKDFPLCGNEIINTKLDTYHHAANTLKTTTIISIVLLNLQILLNIALIIVRYCFQYIETNDNNQYLNDKNYSTDIDYNKCPEEPYYSPNNNNNTNTNAPSAIDNQKTETHGQYSNY